jgi:hypothetical protein
MFWPCYAANMPPMSIRQRFPPPWTVEAIPGGFRVVSQDGMALAYIYARDDLQDLTRRHNLSRSEAHAVAKAIAALAGPVAAPTPERSS